MSPSYRVSPETIVEAMQSKTVRAALAARADKIANTAKSIASNEKAKVDIEREDGTRPKGRPFSRVYSSDVDGEWGTAYTEQRRILGRAAGQDG